MNIIFLDGESKSGKTAVGRSMLEALEQRGHQVRLLVAGNFFRHATLLAIEAKPQNAGDDSWLEAALQQALVSPALLGAAPDNSLLNQPEVERLVSLAGQFGFVQDAAVDWRIASAQRALDDGIEIVLFDGRNLRAKLHDWLLKNNVTTALELSIYCRPEVAAARYLSDSGNTSPSDHELAGATRIIEERRQRDRDRGQAAYIDPNSPINLVVGTDSVDAALAAAFDPSVAEPPRPIRFDNSEVPRHEGLRTVTRLAVKAVDRLV